MSEDQLRSEYERLRAREQELEARMRELEEETTRLGAENERLREQLAEAESQLQALKRELFGPKAEKLTKQQREQLEQLSQDLKDEAARPAALSVEVLEAAPEPTHPAEKKKRAARPRHPLPENLETETIILEPEQTTCPQCGREMDCIDEEVSEQVDLVPARLIRRRTVRRKRACRCGEAGVAIAPLPPRLIPQSELGLGLAVHIVLARYDDHVSLYALERQFRERHGVRISRQRMVQWVDHIAGWLQPVYDAMWRPMLSGGYLQVDETPVRVLDPEVEGKAARGYLWFYAVPGGDVILEFDRSRSMGPVRKRLADFQGDIQTDAYLVYKSLVAQTPTLKRLGCLAHARRKLYDALRENLPDAVWFIAQIRDLYRIEDQVRGLKPAERRAARLESGAPKIWKGMKDKARELLPRFLPKSTIAVALNYFLKDYKALTRYLKNGRFEIDNNLVENAIRPTAVGRKRWLFIGHPDAAWRSAVIYSILISCRRRGINPQDYLTDVLGRLPGMNINQIETILPAKWKPQSSNSN
jgi:transposase